MGNANNLSRAALVVAHPSHELRVHGWMQTAQPCVFVLTDGSGRAAKSRLSSTTKVLADLGASAGSVYGRLTDREIYEAFLGANFSLFLQLVDELAEQLVSRRIEYVVADSDEGYSPTHDVCRLLTDAAVEIVRRQHQREIASFDFAVVGAPDECPEPRREHARWIQLDDEAFLRKIAAVHSYDAKLALDVEAALGGDLFEGVRNLSVPQLAGSEDTRLSDQLGTILKAYSGSEAVKEAFAGTELNRFRTECLRPVSPFRERQSSLVETPFYELYGEQVVGAGHYEQTIRYAEHFLPLAEAVWRHVDSCPEVERTTPAPLHHELVNVLIPNTTMDEQF